MTRDEVKAKLLQCMEIDESDFEDDATVGSFYDEPELEELKEKLGDTFELNVDSMDLETTLGEVFEGLCEHFNATQG